MTIPVLLVAANLEVREETLHSFIEADAVSSEFVLLEVVLEIRWSEATPIDHGSFYQAVVFSDLWSAQRQRSPAAAHDGTGRRLVRLLTSSQGD